MRAFAPRRAPGSFSARPENFSRKARMPLDPAAGSGVQSGFGLGVTSFEASSSVGFGFCAMASCGTGGGGGGSSAVISRVSRSGTSSSSQGSGRGRSIIGSTEPSRKLTRIDVTNTLRNSQSSTPARDQGMRDA
jgi:hypothetical protein